MKHKTQKLIATILTSAIILCGGGCWADPVTDDEWIWPDAPKAQQEEVLSAEDETEGAEMAKIESWFDCDLKRPVQVQVLSGNVFSLDNNGSRIGVKFYDNGQKTTVTGSVSGRFILANGQTIDAITGTLATVNGQSVAYIDVPQSVLHVPGPLKITIQLTDSSVVTTVAAILATVYQTKTDDEIVPSQQVIDDWNAAITQAIGTQNLAIANQDAKIDDLKSAFNKISGQTKNLLPAAYQESSVRGTVAKYDYGVLTLKGAPTASGGRGIHLCPVFTLPAGTYYFSANGITSAVTGIYIQTNVGDTIVRNGSGAFTVASETDYYIGVNIVPNITYNETIYLQIEQGGVATEFMSPITAKDIAARDEITKAENQISDISDRFSIINRFDKSTALRNSYVAPGGGISTTTAGYSASDFIYIGDLENVGYCNTFRLSLYKSDKSWDSDPETQNTVGFVKTITRPSTAMYMRVSYVTANEDVVQVGASISVSQYYPYGKFRMPDLVTDDEPTPEDTVVYVSKSGRGSYTSLLEALVSTNNDIEVVDGVFDIVAEYKAKYGNDFFTSGTDRSAAGDFALGLFITNRSVKFDANTSLSFDLSENPASNSSGDDRRFCLFNLGVNVVLDGAIGTTDGNWYAIHDDGAGGDYAQNYKNVIKNCVLICQNMVNKNVIGGGFGRYSETYVENCYFDNGESGNTSYTIRYHNTWNGQAQPVCHIKNVYVNSLIYFGYYGNSTKIGTCTVNNCSMAGTIVLLPVDASSDENLRVLEWANVIRN